MWNGSVLTLEQFTITHPARDAEHFGSLSEAEARFAKLTAAA
jgi:hypothetical protein